MRLQPPKVQVYITFIITIALVLTCLSVLFVVKNPSILLSAALFALSIFVADMYPISLPIEGNAEATISCALKTAAVIIFGWQFSVMVTFLGTLAAEMMMRREWYKALFNSSEMTITSAAMGFIYLALYDGIDRMPFHSLQNTFAVIVLLLTYWVVNGGLVVTVVSLATGAKFFHVWEVNIIDYSWNNLTLIPLGAVMAALWLYKPWSVVTLLLPLIVVRQSFNYIGELREQTQEALVRMADAVDQRDPSTYEHSQRGAQVAGLLAEEIGLLAADVDTIRMAARLHDLGKIGMSNSLLFKPAKFTPEESIEFHRHAEIGADLVQSFRLFKEGHDLILHHHEQWDGAGYPDGLIGENIPIGCRILGVADAYDAMISRRSYRSPLPLHVAIDELQNNRGSQFDPKVVDAFMRILDRKDSRLPLP